MKMMKNRKVMAILLIVLVGILISACSGQTFAASSWPGMTVDPINNRIYVAFAQQVYALDAASGTPAWTFPKQDDIQTRTGFYAPPVLTEDGKQLIVGGYDNAVYSVDPALGTQLWSFTGAKGFYIASPLVTSKGIFAPNADGSLYALDFQGKQLWTPFVSEHGLWAQPQTDGKLLLVPSVDHNIYAIDPATGRESWSLELDTALIGSPTLDTNGKLYAGSFGKTVSVIDLSTQKVACSFAVEEWLWSSPALEGDTLYIGDAGGTVYAYNKNNCQATWALPFVADGAIYSTPLVVDGSIYFGTETGTIYALNNTGVQRWSKSIGTKVYGSPVLINDLVIFASVGDNNTLQVTAFDAEGLVQWNFTPSTEK